jgi:predicted nucleic acid-binding protein
MLLVDTNVWVDFFKGKKDAQQLSKIIELGDVLIHPFVLTELVIGGLRKDFQKKLELMQFTDVISEEKIRLFIQTENLSGKGLGLVDIHILATARIFPCKIWSFDSYLNKAANLIL